MKSSRRSLLLAIGGTTALAGCLGDDDAEGASDATVQLSAHEDFGDILVGPDRLTLYMFDEDERESGESACYNGCAENWPPLVIEGEPVAGDGVTAPLTTFERADGSRQVAAHGWPLYYWIGDEGEGDVNGQGVNQVWWVLGPDATEIREVPAADEDDDGPSPGGY